MNTRRSLRKLRRAEKSHMLKSLHRVKIGRTVAAVHELRRSARAAARAMHLSAPTVLDRVIISLFASGLNQIRHNFPPLKNAMTK